MESLEFNILEMLSPQKTKQKTNKQTNENESPKAILIYDTTFCLPFSFQNGATSKMASDDTKGLKKNIQ